MKRFIYLFGLLLVSGMAAAQTDTVNYIQSRILLEPVTDSTLLSSAKQIRTVQYFDGLGRPQQVVNVKASPAQKDVVTPIEYDLFGRQVKDYLPVPQSGTQNGAIYTAPLSNASSVYGAEKIYAEKLLESSPLDRILQQKQVGNDWDNHPVQFGYNSNNAAEVKKYMASFNYTTFEATINLSGTFGDNQLYKNTVTDEDGNISIEFKNGQGQTLLVRKHDGSQNVDTYYVYNEYDQLAFVITPLASVAPALDQTTLDNLCYQYKYDGRNRLVEKKLPGKGWEWMVYDQQDRLVATKDAQNQWLFTKYDQFGRVVYTGLADLGTSRQTVQQSFDNLQGAAASNNEARHSAGFYSGNMLIYYSNVSYPTGFSKVLSVNYYDTYPAGTPTIPSTILTQAVLPQDAQNSNISTKSLPTAIYVKNIENDNWTKSYTWYDTKGRAIGSHTINHLGGFTKTESELDFAGAVKQAKTYHKRLNADTEKVISETFTYDPQNRLLSHTHQIDSNSVEILAQNEYNELSQLKTKKVGGNNAALALQTIDYAYNIRGWMTGINDPNNLGSSDLFGYKIKYNTVEGLETPDAVFNPGLQVKSRYNGNIAEVDWKTATQQNEPLKRYGYAYDRINRLLAGFYQKQGNESAGEYLEIMGYDLNGNISSLKRSEAVPAGATTALMIDNLGYQYTGNQLTTVTENQVGNSQGYPYLPVHNIIGYDLNGNMTSHPDKGLGSITYNFLNLPTAVSVGSGKQAKTTGYIYRADGVKVSKMYSFGFSQSSTTTTDYLDGFQYITSIFDLNVITQLHFVPTAEGYFDYQNNLYIYNYLDHLGNVRLSYADNDGDGTVVPRDMTVKNCVDLGDGNIACTSVWKPGEIVESNTYYPFGLQHDYTQTTTNAYQYKYNGKELQETGMYDYGARFYMPDIGRWGVIDPRIQYTQEAYSYVWNNPISFNDPTGMEGELAFPIRDGVKDGEVWHDSDGLFTWDNNKGHWIDANNGSSVITQVSMLKKSNDSSSDGAYIPAITVGASTSKAGVGLAILAVVGIIWTIDHATKPSHQWYTPPPTTIADPGAGMRNLNSESEADDTDVNGVKVPQEGKPDARTEPKDLQEQLAIEEAESGEGDTIMSGKLKDPKYNNNTKMKHTHDHGDGTKTEVHYDIDNKTGKRSGFKIKDGTNAKSRGHRYP
ncbi:MAG: RHS repeat-associated core domain-containing protein [Kaistella sp.]|nr:RHS repeat-associated core domain-containing protein [Kaistella sp.]